ncbi:hypothetical protein [Ottowia sp.]|uniref:hypothetical protein n=1 Tax=Ottowia sp. TaxID=1898956 RepID=UPI002611E81E|nr:hypothetical protein [Ottowia sp.]
MTDAFPNHPEASRTDSQAHCWRAIAAPLLAALPLVLAAGPAAAQLQRSIVNGSFEQPVLTCNPLSWSALPSASVPGWSSTAPDGPSVNCGAYGATVAGPIEFWRSNFNGVPAYEGAQFIELNGHVPARVWQPVCLIQGETYGYSVAHRGRAGIDTLAVGLNPSGDTATAVAMPLNGQAASASNPVATFADPPGAWTVHAGNVTFQGSSGVYQLGFEAAASYNSQPGIGNFLDDVRVSFLPVVELVPGQAIDVTEGASATVRLRVSGEVTAAFDVNLRTNHNGTTSAADYTLPNGSPAAFTVQVPAGSYDGTQEIDIPIGAVADTAGDDGETLDIELRPGSGYTIGGTATCGAAASTMATITIHDQPADMRAALTGFPVQASVPGALVNGQAICTNDGPGPAASATCQVSGLPSGASISCTPTPPVASLAAGASISCAVSFTAPDRPVSLTAVAGAGTVDPQPANNTASLSVGVRLPVPLSSELITLLAAALAGLGVLGLRRQSRPC